MTAASVNQSIEVLANHPHELPAKELLHSTTGSEVYLRLLSLLEQNPAWTQRQIANALGVSLGKTNYCPRALRDKGLVKWGNFSQNPNKLQYMHLLTPKGIAQKLQLTAHFLQHKELDNSNPDPVALTLAPVVSSVLSANTPVGQAAEALGEWIAEHGRKGAGQSIGHVHYTN